MLGSVNEDLEEWQSNKLMHGTGWLTRLHNLVRIGLGAENNAVIGELWIIRGKGTIITLLIQIQRRKGCFKYI